MLQGTRLDFDAESRELYDAVAPTYDEAHFARALEKLETLVPGPGGLADRVEALRQRVAIPRDKLDVVFKAAIAECRARTVGPPLAARRRGVPAGVRHRQTVERLQLVSGQVSQPDPDQHRAADLHRSRGRSRLPRRLSGASRLQRPARAASGRRIAAGASSRSIRCSRRSR